MIGVNSAAAVLLAGLLAACQSGGPTMSSAPPEATACIGDPVQRAYVLHVLDVAHIPYARDTDGSIQVDSQDRRALGDALRRARPELRRLLERREADPVTSVLFVELLKERMRFFYTAREGSGYRISWLPGAADAEADMFLELGRRRASVTTRVSTRKLEAALLDATPPGCLEGAADRPDHGR